MDNLSTTTPLWLAREVATVMADVLLHQRPRWGALLDHHRQFEGWWKAEMILALESWTWRADLQSRPFGVLAEAKPRAFGLGEESSSVDILVAPWDEQQGRFIAGGAPRVWIELKERATWWGQDNPSQAAKAMGRANSGIWHDLEKWKRIGAKGDIFLACQVTSHEGSKDERLPGHWIQQFETIAKSYDQIMARAIGFPLSGGSKIKWIHLDCFVAHVCE